MSKGRPSKEPNTVVVVFRKTPKGKSYIQVFKGIEIESLISTRKHIQLIPDNYIIEEIGIGKSMIEEYKKEYNIKSVII